MMMQRMMERDGDGDGQISRDEAPPPLLRMFDEMDTNDDGELTSEELTAFIEAKQGTIEEKLTEKFDEIDSDDDGFISPEELEQYRKEHRKTPGKDEGKDRGKGKGRGKGPNGRNGEETGPRERQGPSRGLGLRDRAPQNGEEI